jgi:hypothetical protein
MNKKITIISLRIIIIFSIAMLMSFLPELIPDFFGDEICTQTKHIYCGNYCYGNAIHWGYRHWLYFFMGFALFVTQAISLMVYINED